jgi:aldehyde dehydrogenase (NAD+)
MKDEHVRTFLTISTAISKIRTEPLGVALIIGSWNYPFIGIIQPLSQAISAGNLAIIKPSELAPFSAKVVEKLVKTYLDPDCFQCIMGGVEVAIEITTFPFDLIIYTGSTDKGKLVAAAAAKNLTPCILELGGKSPMIVDEGCDIDWASKRAIFGRSINCGQTCIASDYILVHANIEVAFKRALLKNLEAAWAPLPLNQ